MSESERRVRGTIVLAQEHRFQLVDDRHEHLLCELDSSVPVGAVDLTRLVEDATRVEVRFTPSQHKRSVVVHEMLREARDGSGFERVNERGYARFSRVLKSFWHDWSLRRQLRGADSRGEAARSEWARSLSARTDGADCIGTSICPFCAVGCAQLVYARNEQIIQIEGDPRSPINAGTLCPK